MTIDSVLAMKANERLIAAMREAASKKISQCEMMEQRVSFVYGSIGTKNGAEKDAVRQIILNQTGATQTAPA